MASLPFSESEYRGRQSKFLEKIPQDCLVLIPTNPASIRSNDVHYPFRASSYMLYLSGWSEPESVLMAKHNGKNWLVSLFVQPNDTTAEIWQGRRIGIEGASSGWPIDEAYSLLEMNEIVTDSLNKSNGVYLIQNLNSNIDQIVHDALTSKTRQRNTYGMGPISLVDPSSLLDEMRICKSTEEIAIMQKSADIASMAHSMAMKKSHAGIGEWEIQAIIEGCFQSNGSHWSYPSIVGGGDNATILHYHANNQPVSDGELVLVDAGCEVEGYASDITRTWPVNGKFSDPQREIYNLVLEAEISGIEACRVGAPWNASHKAAMEVISRGLIELGILNCSFEEAMGEDLDGKTRQFFMHGTSHSLGLDVHDVGVTRPGGKGDGRLLEQGMVLTVEPGIYFASWREDVEIPAKYAGIGIRIEDDVLITKDGPVVLTSNCPKQITEIETLVGSGL